MNTFKLIAKIVLFLFLTIIVWSLTIYILSEVYKLNNYVSGGVAYSIVLYTWGIYFLNKEKIFGAILFTLAVMSNLLLIATPYNTNSEYASTRFFALITTAAGIYLICRKPVASKIFGILLLVFTVLNFILGLFFMIGNLDI
jgi:hypothetical protein